MKRNLPTVSSSAAKSDLTKEETSTDLKRYFPFFLIAILLIIGTFFASAWYFSKNKTIVEIQNRQVQNDKIVTKTQQITIDTSNLKVPEPMEQVADKEIAIPKTARESVVGSSNKLRIFPITVTNGTFSAQKIIVNQNDVVRIELTADGQLSDLTIPSLGLKQQAQSGETKLMEFQAPGSGMYPFYCEACGKEAEKAAGILLVVGKT